MTLFPTPPALHALISSTSASSGTRIRLFSFSVVFLLPTFIQMHAHVLLQMSLESVSVREEPEGMIAIQLASGLRCVLAVGHDYPRAHAALRIARWEDSNG